VTGTRPLMWPQQHKDSLSPPAPRIPPGYSPPPLLQACRQRSTWQACGHSTTTQLTGRWTAVSQL
jgi:hypothetical protein